VHVGVLLFKRGSPDQFEGQRKTLTETQLTFNLDNPTDRFLDFSHLHSLVLGIVSGAWLIPAVHTASAVVPWETDRFTWVT